MIEAPAGFHGKLPATGDFVQRRLAASFVNTWDQWLQRVLHASREHLGDRWLDIYLSSPIWRFALAPGACGDSGQVGILVPSVDSVGRYFPLAVMRPMQSGETALSVAAGSQLWFDAAQQCVVDVLQNRSITLDEFDRSILALGPSLVAVMPQRPETPLGDFFEKSLGDIHEIGSHVAVLAGDRVDGHLSPACHWWTLGSDRLNACWMASRGLPSPGLFVRMLSGEALPGTAQYDGDLLADLLGPGENPTTRIDDTKADILGLFTAPDGPHAASDPLLSGADFDAEITHPRRTEKDPSVLASSVATTPLDDSESSVPPMTVRGLPGSPKVFQGSESEEVTRRRPNAGEIQSMLGTMQALPEDLSDLVTTVAEPSATIHLRSVLRRDDCALTVVAATDQIGNVPRPTAAAVLAQVRELRPAELVAGMQSMRERLLDVHRRLLETAAGLPVQGPEQCSLVAARVRSGQAAFLRFGAGSAWRYRHGHLQLVLAMGYREPPNVEPLPNDGLDELLFGIASYSDGGIGSAAPTWDESSCMVQPGDRLVLAATRRLVELPFDVLVRSLAMRTSRDAAMRIAVSADLGGDPDSWPFAVVDILV